MPERSEGAQTPYEVHCPRCRVTFPVGTRRCLHCGGRVGARAETPFRAPLTASPERAELPPEEEEEELAGAALRRFGGLAVWAVLLVAALLSNLCSR